MRRHEMSSYGKRMQGERERRRLANEELDALAPTRILGRMTGGLSILFPEMFDRIDKRRVDQLLNMMSSIGMITASSHTTFDTKLERLKYADSIIDYERAIEKIAAYLEINPNDAIAFVRTCFAANNHDNLYPIRFDDPGRSKMADTYIALDHRFDKTLAQCIASYLVGETTPHLIKVTFSQFIDIMDTAKRFTKCQLLILQGCISFKRKCLKNSKCESRCESSRESRYGAKLISIDSIYIDEFIAHLIDEDEAEYTKHQEEISKLLSPIDGRINNNCEVILKMIGASSMASCMTTIQSGFLFNK